MLPHRPDVVSIWLTLLFSTVIAALSLGVGFSISVAAIVGVATATVGVWATVSEP